MDSTVIVVALIIILAVVVPALVIGRFAVRSQRQRALRPPTEQAGAGPTVVSLGDKLAATRSVIGARLGGLVRRADVDDAFWSQLEEMLIAADVGVPTAAAVTARVRASSPTDAGSARQALRDELVACFVEADRHLPPLRSEPVAFVIVGVNGSGKTTTMAKLAQRYRELGASALLGAADTFRAGATEQLGVWGRRLGVEVVSGEEGSDPAAVAHDAIARGKSQGVDVVMIDTAGRLHSNTNLMDELAKVVRIVEREAGRIDEVLLVLDGSGGQNSLAQARTFTEAVGVTGIVITKLDGTARGGIAMAVESELAIPIKLIGVGEAPEDLMPFDPRQFVDALLEVPDVR